jgi:hypothetical protein
LPSINTSPAYRASEDSRRFDTQEIKKPDSNLKIMIPVAAGVIGIVIAVVIFGSGMMHQQAQPSTSLPTPTPTVQYPQPHNIANAGIKVQNSILSYVNSFFTHVHTTSVNTPVNIALIPRQEIEYREAGLQIVSNPSQHRALFCLKSIKVLGTNSIHPMRLSFSCIFVSLTYLIQK